MKKLKLFLSVAALLCSVGSWAQASPKAGVVPEVGAEYYLYNIASGRYMSRGSSYTTHVTVDGCGEVITVGGTEGSYTLHMASVSDANAFVSNDNWIDGADSRKGEFSFVTATKDGYSNVYKLQLKGATTGYYWSGGSGAWGNECNIGELSENEEASLWLFIPKATRQTLSAEGDDATFAVTNPDFERFTDFGGWTREGAGKEGDWNQSNGAAGTMARFMERWTGTWNTTTGSGEGGTLYDASLKQTVTLPAGKYRLSANVWAVNQATSAEVTGVTLYAGTAQQNISRAASADVVTVDFTTTGSVEIGLIIKDANANWVGIDNIRLTFMGEDLSLLVEAYHNALTAANAVDQEAPMTGTILTALQKAISDYATVDESSKEALNAAISALKTATDNATASIAAYEKLKAAIDKANAVKTANSFVTADAATTFGSAISTATNGWTDATFTDDEATAQVTTLGTAVSGWHANATGAAGVYMTSAWGKNSENWWDAPYINTWSTEGDNDGTGFSVPFFEYYTGDKNNLGANTFTATLSGLENGCYDVELWARVQRRSDANFNADNSMITMSVNGGDKVSIMDGSTKVNEDKTNEMRLGRFTARGMVTDGTLTLSIDVVLGSNVHWLSWRDVKYKKIAVESVTVTDAGWATYCSPSALDFSSVKGLKAYIITGTESGTTLALSAVSNVPANTGVLLQGEAGNYVIPVAESSATDVSANKLVGVTANTEIAAGAGYVLMNETAGVGFYKNNKAFTVGANTAYLPANFASGARSAYFFDSITGVEAVEAASEAVQKEGKFIIEGKLFIFKNGKKFNANGQLVK